MGRPLTAAAASVLLAAGGVVVPALMAPAAAVPTPTPSTPTLPVPAATVDPARSVGGERLASMGLVVDRPASVPPPPPLRDVAWLLADLDSGEVVAAKAAHARLRPASTLKVLTALTLIPRLDATASYTASAADAAADGTRVGLIPGQPYTGAQLFSALLMASGNDAAYALARAGGGMEQTVAQMNARARDLGAHDTLVRDPSGLDAPGQVSSVYDLALIGRAALQLPEFRAYVTTRQLAFPGRPSRGGARPSYVIANHNRLLHNYEGTIGVKNGYTRAAKRTFISAVSRGGKRYILTEMYGLDSSWRPQAALYDWAFRYADRLRPVGRLVEPGTVAAPPAVPPARTASQPAGDAGAPAAASAGAAPVAPRVAGAERPVSPWLGATGLGAAALLVLGLAARARAGLPRRH